MTICAEFAGRTAETCTRGVEGCVCGFDSPERIIEVLEAHNRWRRGEDGAQQTHPFAIGKAIDAAVKLIRASREGQER